MQQSQEDRILLFPNLPSIEYLGD